MGRFEITCLGNGLILDLGNKKIAIDKVSRAKCDYHFISHAHTDHLPNRLYGKAIASEETIKLASKRGVRIKTDKLDVGRLELLDSGHILGSRALLIEDRILYTGDVNIRDRFFIKGFKPINVEILIIEATYGRKDYTFGEMGKIIDDSLKYVTEAISSGRNIVAIGYALGKAQILTKLFNWCENLIVHDEVAKFNKIYEAFGIDLGEYISFREAVEKRAFKDKNWIFISPKDVLSRRIAEKYDAIMVEFTGWAKSSSYSYRSGIDRGFPLSDHSDFKDLLDIVKLTEPCEVYVAYGFTSEFARSLRERGFKAEPLVPNQKITVNF